MKFIAPTAINSKLLRFVLAMVALLAVSPAAYADDASEACGRIELDFTGGPPIDLPPTQLDLYGVNIKYTNYINEPITVNGGTGTCNTSLQITQVPPVDCPVNYSEQEVAFDAFNNIRTDS